MTTPMLRRIVFTPALVLLSLSFTGILHATYPVVRPKRATPPPESGRYVIRPDREKQVVWGLGFEIQSDSIASGNASLPEANTSVPHDLTPSERERFAREMLAGFRYCRLAGGLYWRGLDEQQQRLEPRWPTQLDEIREMMEAGGIEGLSFEYWSPAPFWKANGQYTKFGQDHALNQLRCFGPEFNEDPVYHGDVDRFLADFASAVVDDLRTLRAAGLPVLMWGLQNEPFANPSWSACVYSTSEYSRVFPVVARAVREYDPDILIIADTDWGAPHRVAPVMRTPQAGLVDALVVHAIGDDSRQVPDNVRETRKIIEQELPLFQNEYEYLQGPASRDRCVNTVQNIMNWYQLAGSPTWFWLHALKPLKNAEASGYSLGYWMPVDPDYTATHNVLAESGFTCPRTSDRFECSVLPDEVDGLFYVTINRGNGREPAPAYTFTIDKPARVYLAVQDRGTPAIPEGWERTDLKTSWEGQFADSIYKRIFDKGTVALPGHDGRDEAGFYGVPNLAFVEDVSGETVVLNVSDLPESLGGKTGTVVQRDVREMEPLEPGHWTWNPYNWHSVVGFLKHMPWDSTVVEVEEEQMDHDLRILAFKRPDGRLVFVLSNRCSKDYTFEIATGLQDALFQGYRYTPDETGKGFMGVELDSREGGDVALTVPDRAWEFWVEQ